MSDGITRFVGVDLGDQWSHVVVLDEDGKKVESKRVRTRAPQLRGWFSGRERMRVALEVGTHSPWISRLIAEEGHEMVVANPRQLKLIFKQARKSDWKDAEFLARLVRLDPELLHPIMHRGPQAQRDLGVLRSREALIRARTGLVNHVRGQVKSLGERLQSCSADSFARRVTDELPEDLRGSLEPIVEQIGELTKRIRGYDRQVEQLCAESYPETGVLKQVRGVGSLTALAFVLTIEDPARFRKSREVGPFVGLVPKKDQSGNQNPQLGISKTGDLYLRRLLVSAARYILGPFGEDCDLRRHGERICARGGHSARSRAAIAVARKLAVLLHRLWVTGEEYEPLRQARINGVLEESAA